MGCDGDRGWMEAGLRTVVLVLIKQVLHLLLIHLDLDLVALFELLSLAVLVAQLGLAVVQLLFRDLPECVDLVLRADRNSKRRVRACK